MMNNQTTHAQQVVTRFQNLLAENGAGTLNQEHSEELALLIEAALDAVTVEHLERTAVKLEQMASDLRHKETFG